MLQKFRSAIGNALMTGLEIVGVAISGSGTVVAIVLGKLFAAAVLAAITLGVFLRLAMRGGQRPAEPPPTPRIKLACALLSLIEVAILTEATNLPVRLAQPGFEKSNWLIVIAALAVIYLVQVRFFRSVLLKHDGTTQPTRP
jgi:hypothetical protein